MIQSALPLSHRYCQGMGMIVASLLLVMEEHEALCVFTAMTHRLMPQSTACLPFIHQFILALILLAHAFFGFVMKAKSLCFLLVTNVHSPNQLDLFEIVDCVIRVCTCCHDIFFDRLLHIHAVWPHARPACVEVCAKDTHTNKHAYTIL